MLCNILLKMKKNNLNYPPYFTAYVTNEGKPYVLPVVRKVEAEKAKDTTLMHEYLPIVGREDLIRGAINLIFGYSPEYVAKVAILNIFL